MDCGFSTACLYPRDTLECLKITAALGPACAEVFLNTFCELEPAYVQALCQARSQGGLNVVSVHPFSCEMEPFFFYTDYAPRFEDGLVLYRKYFCLCQQLGAKVLVTHGNRNGRTAVPMQVYAQRFCRLCEEGEKYGIIVAQENVERCQCGQPQNIRLLRQCASRPLHFVLDLKQALRAGVDALEMVDAMGPQNICHLHLSDADGLSDCKLPGQGDFDFAGLFRALFAGGFAGSAVVELYSDGYQAPEQLLGAARYLQNLANAIKEEHP